MRLTGFAKVFVTLVILAVLGYVFYTYRDRLGTYRDKLMPARSTAESTAPKATTAASTTQPDAPPPPERKNVLASIRKSGVLRVGMEPDAPPLHFLNEDKQEDGFDFRLAARMAERLGAKRVAVVEADYEELPAKMLKGDFDIIMAGYVPDPDVQGVQWSQGYLDFGLVMIVHEGMMGTIRDVGDLRGKVVAIYDDPAAERWVRDNIPGATVRKFSGDSGWFEAVESGAADALIYDYPFASVEIKKHPQTVIAKYNLNKSKYAVGVPANNYDLIYEINQALDTIKSSDDYARLMKQYLSSRSEAFMQPVAGRKTHKVTGTDTLSLIARRHLGEAARWPEIWELNKDRVADPNVIYPGLVLILP